MPDASAAEPVMLAGRARAIGDARNAIAVGWCDLDAGDDNTQRARHEKPFEVMLDDGHVVRIDGFDGPLVRALVPEYKLHAAWETLETSPLGSLIDSNAPGPLVKTKLRGCVVKDGDRVFVIGRVTESTFDDGTGSLRTAAEPRPGVVRAIVVGVGDDAEDDARKQFAALQPKPKPAEGPRRAGPTVTPQGVVFGVAFALGCAGAVMAAARPSPFTPAWWAIALGAFASAIVLCAPVARLPRFASGEKASLPTPLPVIVGLVWFVALCIGFLANTDEQYGSATYLVVIGAPVAAALACALYALILHLRTRSIRAAIASLLPSVRPRGRWTTRQGVVHSDSPLRSASGARAVATWRPGRGSKICEGGVTLRSDGGIDYELPLGRAVWWSSVATFFVEKKQEAEGWETLIPLGARVLVAGRLDETGKEFVPGGRSSLFAFGCDADEDPVAHLRRAQRNVRLALAGLLGLGLASGALLGATLVGRRSFVRPVLLVRDYAVRPLASPQWIEACTQPGAMTVLANVDDAATQVASPFAVRLYDRSFGGPFVISSNGWVSLVSSEQDHISGHLPSTSTPNAVLAPYWTDLHTGPAGICAATVGAAPHRRWVVEWPAMYECCTAGDSLLAFEAVVDEAPSAANNTLTFVYATMQPRSRRPAVGIEDASGTRAALDGGPFVSSRGVQYTPVY